MVFRRLRSLPSPVVVPRGAGLVSSGSFEACAQQRKLRLHVYSLMDVAKGWYLALTRGIAWLSTAVHHRVQACRMCAPAFVFEVDGAHACYCLCGEALTLTLTSLPGCCNKELLHLLGSAINGHCTLNPRHRGCEKDGVLPGSSATLKTWPPCSLALLRAPAAIKA